MTKQLWWTVSSLLLAASLSLSGCDEVESCKVGTAGCVGGAPEDGECKFGLTVDPTSGKCVDFEESCPPGTAGCEGGNPVDGACRAPFVVSEGKCLELADACPTDTAGCPGGATKDGGCKFGLVLDPKTTKCAPISSVCPPGTAGCLGGPASDGACRFDLLLDTATNKCINPADCVCPREGEVCTTDSSSCQDFCEVPDRKPGSEAGGRPDFIPCAADQDAPALTLDELAVNACKLRCQRTDWFCDSGCAPNECDPAGVAVTALKASCAAQASPADCMALVCDDYRHQDCLDAECPGGKTPNCKDIVCRYDCSLDADAWCDDGDVFGTTPGVNDTDTDSPLCGWGTDCAGCGPRQKTEEVLSVGLPVGAPCTWGQNCAGFRELPGMPGTVDLSVNEAICVDGGGSGVSRCVQDCSRTGYCPAGTTCEVLRFGDAPLVQDGITGRACLPAMCE